LSQGARTGSSRGRGPSYPYLLACDRTGRVLWMSEQAQAVLGSAANLVGSIPLWESVPTASATPVELSYTRLLDLGEVVLVGARLPSPPGDAVRQQEIDLLRLECNLLLHYFRLRQAEDRLSRRTRQGGSSTRALRQIELERQRLGRELHTTVGQQLSAIRLQSEIVAAALPPENQVAQQALDRILTLTADALEQVRSISKMLHPPEWQRLPLETALQQLWETSGIPERFAGSLRVETLPQDPSLEAKILIYRAAQEAASNLVRHSRATQVEAVLGARAGQLVLRIQDNGVGFDVDAVFRSAASIGGGIGLRSIREQADELGGRLVVESGPGGTTLEVTVPIVTTGT
jgi:signal transduction histidine kinase